MLDGELTVEPQPVLRLSLLLTVRDAVVPGAAMLPRSIIVKMLEKRRTGVVGKCWRGH